ncbi:MAG TPA: NUDIX hydrolase [Vicinamibacterales bacterium]|jgi:ADP-ribose pyrophosphatase|nr:NUDIX hydrolase [Vicinamibacterales bacterium]
MSIIYKGRVFSVEVDRVTLPNGKAHEMAIVRHPPSVVLIPLIDAAHVVLIRQYRHSLAREIWELPAGSLESGESAEAAAARECEEEIALRPGRIERLASFYPTPGFCDEELIFFRVSDLRQPPADSPHKPDDDEDIQPQTFSVAEARAMVARGEIIDLKTAYGLTLAHPSPPLRIAHGTLVMRPS